MKRYLIHVEAEDFISVDAETDQEAIEEAEDIASGGFAEWTGRVMSSEDLEDGDDE